MIQIANCIAAPTCLTYCNRVLPAHRVFPFTVRIGGETMYAQLVVPLEV